MSEDDDARLLPEEVETWIVNAILDERCSQKFADEVRERMLDMAPRVESGACPNCRGKGIVKAGKYEEGCDLCAGTGNIKVVPGSPRSPGHGLMSRTLKRRSLTSTK